MVSELHLRASGECERVSSLQSDRPQAMVSRETFAMRLRRCRAIAAGCHASNRAFPRFAIDLPIFALSRELIFF